VATLTPQGQTAGHRAAPLRSSRPRSGGRTMAATEMLRWLRSMLDRPLAELGDEVKQVFPQWDRRQVE